MVLELQEAACGDQASGLERILDGHRQPGELAQAFAATAATVDVIGGRQRSCPVLGNDDVLRWIESVDAGEIQFEQFARTGFSCREPLQVLCGGSEGKRVIGQAYNSP